MRNGFCPLLSVSIKINEFFEEKKFPLLMRKHDYLSNHLIKKERERKNIYRPSFIFGVILRIL